MKRLADFFAVVVAGVLYAVLWSATVAAMGAVVFIATFLFFLTEIIIAVLLWTYFN